jgi:two-component system, chemotaxis family, chemotaxis protein CheY
MAKILVVDDTQFMRQRVARLLREHDYQTIEAKDGEEAVRMYEHDEPDLVLMDITMPNMDGLAALGEIRAYDPAAKVIMLTALGQQAIALQAIQSGAKDFLVKPYEPDQVLRAVQRVLG